MPTTVGAGPAVALRVDALARFGVGHLVRMLALAEELAARGRAVRLFGACDVPWAAGQLATAGLVLEPAPADPAEFAALLDAAGIRLCVVDGYEFPPALGEALRAGGVAVAALSDGEFGLGQVADLYLDQNLGAVPRPDRHPGARFLTGLEYALLRDRVRDRRRPPRPADGSRTPRVLVVFGGTDPYGGCPTVAGLLLGLGLPVEVVAIAATPAVAASLRALATGAAGSRAVLHEDCRRSGVVEDPQSPALMASRVASGQTLAVHPPVDDLPALAITCDAAVSAAGSSTWELACLGVPTALVCVTDNQWLGYREATRGLCLPGGRLADLRPGGADVPLARATLTRLLTDADLRHSLARRAAAAVDGRGRERVVDALLALEAERAASSLR